MDTDLITSTKRQCVEEAVNLKAALTPLKSKANLIKRTFTRLHSIFLIHHQNWHGKSLMVLTCWNNLIDMKLAQITRVVVMSLMRLSKICELCIILAII